MSAFHTAISHQVPIPRSDRWQVYQRLEQLAIPCACPADGSLRVDISSLLQGLLLRSVVQQQTAARSELIDWLNRCWCIH